MIFVLMNCGPFLFVCCCDAASILRLHQAVAKWYGSDEFCSSEKKQGRPIGTIFLVNITDKNRSKNPSETSKGVDQGRHDCSLLVIRGQKVDESPERPGIKARIRAKT